MLPTTFQDLGIPGGYGFKQLLFSTAANVLVVHTTSAEDNWRPERLYFRRMEAAQYRPVGSPTDLVSQECPFIHSSEPLLAYNCNQHEFTLDSEGRELHAGDWHSLEIVSLTDGSLIRSVNAKTLRLPSGMSQGRICEIVAFGESGLFVKVALSENNASYHYAVARLDGDQLVGPFISLPAVFM